MVALLSALVTRGLYFVWFPTHSTLMAELVGVGRGVDLILYVCSYRRLACALADGADHHARRAGSRVQSRSGFCGFR